jgi:RNA polymerase sigma factor (sigma-70 family)
VAIFRFERISRWSPRPDGSIAFVTSGPLAHDLPSRLGTVLAAIDRLAPPGTFQTGSTQELLVRLFNAESRSLVRLARLFVDDREAAEDIVQEAFIRLARRAHTIDVVDKAPAYLRSIVLNLARDHNRRGLVSLRHRATSEVDVAPFDDPAAEVADRLARDDRHIKVLACVRQLPVRQRDCVTLRYLEGYSTEQIASTLGLSVNSVKTHLRRGLTTLRRTLAAERVR